MGEVPPGYWPLDDLAGNGDLAQEYGVNKSAIVNWSNRYEDFPAPLTEVSTGPIYSRSQVREWHDSRKWKPGWHKPRIAAETT